MPWELSEAQGGKGGKEGSASPEKGEKDSEQDNNFKPQDSPNQCEW